MSYHLSATSAVLLVGAGAFAYVKTQSFPSLLGASALGLIFTASSALAKSSDRQFLAHALGAGAGTAALVIGARRYPKASRKFAPGLLIAVGICNLPYHAAKMAEWSQ